MNRGLNAIGLPNATDFNSGTLVGAGYAATTIDPSNGYRSSSRNSFLSQASSRKNLAIKSSLLAKYIVFNGTRAIGVMTHPTLSGIGGSGTKDVYYARRELIVSGGAFHSPALLKASGIGPAAELTKLNIPVKVDLPGVGGNLQVCTTLQRQGSRTSNWPDVIHINRIIFSCQYSPETLDSICIAHNDLFVRTVHQATL